MKKNIAILSLIILSTVIFAQKPVSIKGKVLNNTDYQTIYLNNIMLETVLDSAKLTTKGEFKFELKIENPDFHKVYFDDTNYILLILAPGENVDITIDINDMYKPVIKGSKNSELVYTTLKTSQDLDKKVEDYKNKIAKEKKEYIKKMINENATSLACLFFIDQLDMNEDFATYKKLSEGLSKIYTGNSLVDDLKKRVESKSKLAIGSEAPEIDLPSPEGKNIKLSSLRGKVVLIDFWASWCGPCRKESPNMVKIYEKFHSKGFEIYSVSFDESKEKWTDAISKDGLGKWTHVSDLKYWECAAGQSYGIEAIPYTVLIDKDGNIIAKELRGDDLEKKLDEVFKK